MLALKLRSRTPSNSRCHCISSSSAAAAAAAAWTTAIRAATQLGRFRHALSLYARMHSSGQRSDPHAVSAALKACARIPSKPSAAAIHAHVHKHGHQADVYATTALLDAYSKLDGVGSAQKLFGEMPLKCVASWNSLLSSFLRAGELDAAQDVFDKMPVKDVVSWNSIVAGYARTGDMDRASALFSGMPEKNAASWNGMISGYINRGEMRSARELFDRMPMRSNVSWIAMISGYARCGDVGAAHMLFETMDERDVISWNSMIACFAQNECPREALRFFNLMHKIGGVQPDEITFSSVISACSQLGELRYGLWIEKHMCSSGVELDDHLRTALIDLYSKYGDMDRAFELFDSLRRRDLVSYSAMILGCGINGRSIDAIHLFKETLDAKVDPNAVTFLGLLTAYNHAGLVDDACRCFSSMWSQYRVVPSVDHYAIMVDVLGRSGRLEEAYQLIQEMPTQPHVGVWGALLLACRLHGKVELGELAAQHCFELEPNASGYYILLASIYSEAKEWDKAKRLRDVMFEEGLTKLPGSSWVQPS